MRFLTLLVKVVLVIQVAERVRGLADRGERSLQIVAVNLQQVSAIELVCPTESLILLYIQFRTKRSLLFKFRLRLSRTYLGKFAPNKMFC